MAQDGQERLVAGDEEAPPVKSFTDRFAVAIVFTIFVCFRAADRVFLKDVNNALSRSTYNLIWSNLLWPLAIQIMTIGMLLVYICILRRQGHTEYSWRFFLPGNAQASTMGPVPLYQLALFSIGDQLNAASSAPASPFVALPIQSVMTNSVIIWMVIIAYFWIRARFKQVHFIGICLVMMSIVVQISNKLTSNDCSAAGMASGDCFGSYKDADGDFIRLTASQMAIWYTLFFCSNLPAAAGNVYKQKVLQGRDVDVCYATWWSGNFQVLWGWLFLPLIWIPLPGQDVQGPGATFSEIADTLSCIMGNVPKPGDETCASSPPPWVWIVVYLCFNITFNIALLWLTKRMSAAWAQVATVLCLNLCSIFSQFKWAAGDSAQIMSLNDWLGLILASIALWVYNLQPETTADGGEAQTGTHVAGANFVADGPAQLISTLSSKVVQSNVEGTNTDVGGSRN
jgi:hypothetical protein